jgi:membrane protein DedA with SNARE-associated domain
MADAIFSFITEYGYLAVFFLMVLENVFPPIPSEVILPFIGYAAAEGQLNLVLAVFVATLGSLLGTSLWFLIGWLVPATALENFFRKYGGFVAIELKDFQLAVRTFTRFERTAVFVGRFIPGVRSVISIPAGSVRMPVQLFLVLSLCGTFLWNMMLVLVGFFILGDFSVVEQYMAPVSDMILLGFLLLYILQVVRFILRRFRERVS